MVKPPPLPLPPRLSKFQTGPLPRQAMKLVLVAVEGWGKTTVGANLPNAVIVMSENETGYKTLLGEKSVPDIPRVVTTTWSETLALIPDLTAMDNEWIVFDEISGFEKQLFEVESVKHYKGNIRNFFAFQNGPSGASIEMANFLANLERTGKNIMILSHCKIEKFKDDPENEGYSRYASALHSYDWAVVKQWSDASFFGTYRFIRDNETGKALDAQDRMLFTTRKATHDAKNRYHMEEVITMPEDPNQMWPTIINEINREK